MHKILLVFSFIISAIAGKAQIVTNIYWTEQTSMPKAQTIYYNSSNKLEWRDFKGTPVTTGIVAAITMSGFGYTASMKSDGKKGEINIGVYCYFSKEKSWVKPGKTTPYILNHEQHHFDITYIAACLFASRLRSANITTDNINSVVPRIYKECCDIMNKMQDDYDGQTKNGQLKDVQEKWNAELESKLAAVTK